MCVYSLSLCQIHSSKSNLVIPLREIIVPNNWCGFSPLPIEDFDIAISFGEVISPEPCGTLHLDSQGCDSGMTGTAVGIDVLMSTTFTGTVRIGVPNFTHARGENGVLYHILADGFAQSFSSG